MRVIVSKTLKDVYTQFAVVKSFKQLKDIGNVTHVIIHSFEDDDLDVGLMCSDLRSAGVARFIYINEKPSSMIRMLIQGFKGFYIEDEFYLDDEEELLALLDELESSEDKEETSLAAPSITIISNFVRDFANRDPRIETPVYLEQVNNAVTELVTINKQQELQLSTMGETTLDVFRKVSSLLKSFDDNNRILQQQLADLEDTRNYGSQKATLGNSIMFFAPYKYIGNAKVLVVREYSPCRYLTSFMIAYNNHLHYELNKRCKLIFVHNKGVGISRKYDAYTSITQESMSMSSLYDEEIIATNNPKKEVMKELLNKPVDVIVVVDRLYGSQDIVSGRVTRLDVASGMSDINNFKLNIKETVVSVSVIPDALFVLRSIKNYPEDISMRLTAYNAYKDAFKILDKKVGIING